ncbi:hypothetical protein [Listeria seeligeri]|uniref:hypothetical protein n=1 Tax=Listeria seeligeri TaxID=1640 RepID=UPI001626A090|nr:hypothetical protein [Listeria seeligeri]MBC1471814.1 hypothetical protein [Listeria seeligeri]
MATKYHSESLDIALSYANSSILEERKKGEKILRTASCLALGTKNTIPVRTWFISHTDALMKMISSEKDSSLLWGYIYMLQSFCCRYIHKAQLVKNSEDFMRSEATIYFEEQAILLVNRLTTSDDRKVLQAVGSFLWVYKDNRAWDIFIKVLSKKKDKLTLSHITIAISALYDDIIKTQQNAGELISKSQVQELIDIFLIIGPKSSMPLTCAESVAQLSEVVKLIK